MAFASENQAVAGTVLRLGVVLCSGCAEENFPTIEKFCRKFSKGWETVEFDGVPVVESGALDIPIGQPEAERLDQIENRASRSAQPGDIAGVLRDFRLDQHNMEGRVGPVKIELITGSESHAEQYAL